jgi:hypothetical protein
LNKSSSAGTLVILDGRTEIVYHHEHPKINLSPLQVHHGSDGGPDGRRTSRWKYGSPLDGKEGS